MLLIPIENKFATLFFKNKVLKVSGDQYDFQIFGSYHDSATVNKRYIKPIDCDIEQLVVGWRLL